jgi:UDP-glucose 4-epimerase
MHITDSSEKIKKRWLVLGAGGFIGINLCRKLLSLGIGVIAIGRQGKIPQYLQGCTWITGDYLDKDFRLYVK